jgi:hypothetical protein
VDNLHILGLFASLKLYMNPTENLIESKPYMNPTKNLVELKLYMNPTKNLIEPKLYMNPTKNLIETKLYMNPTENLIESKPYMNPNKNLVELKLYSLAPGFYSIALMGSDLLKVLFFLCLFVLLCSSSSCGLCPMLSVSLDCPFLIAWFSVMFID